MSHGMQAKTKKIIVVSFCAILVLGIHLRNLLGVYAPFLFPEEFGYWANAAAMNGYDWSYLGSKNPWYSYGYSLILSPLFMVFSNIHIMYKAAIVMNGIFMGLYFCCLYSFGKMLKISSNDYLIILCSICVSVYSYMTFFSSIASPEIFLSLLVLLTICFAQEYIVTLKCRYVLLALLSSFGAYSVHNRAIVLIVLLPIWFVYVFYKNNNMNHIFLLGIYMPLLASYKIISAYIEKTVYGNTLLKAARTEVSKGDLEGGITNIIRYLTEWRGIIALLVSFICKYWYASAATFLLISVSILIIVKKIITSNEKEIYILVLSIYLAALAVASIFMFEYLDAPTIRMDTKIYGRYAEYCVQPLLLVGLLTILSCESIYKKRIWAIGIIYLFIRCGMIVSMRFEAAYSSYPEKVLEIPRMISSVSGIGYYSVLGEFDRHSFIINCTILSLIIFGVSFFVLAISKPNHKIRYIIIAIYSAMFLYAGNYSTQIYTLPPQEDNIRSNFIDVVRIIENKNKCGAVIVDSNNIFYTFDFQTYLYESRVYDSDAIDYINLDEIDFVVELNKKAEKLKEKTDKYTEVFSNEEFTVLERVD